MKPVPYIYQIERNNKLLVYYGADHSFDPAHKQWQDIKEYFNQFIKKTAGKNCVVLVEGGGTERKNSESEAIREGGEPLFTTFIANKVGLRSISPEPDEQYEIIELLKTFSKEQIMHYYFTRLVDQWNRYKTEKPEFESYMNKFLVRYKNVTKWKDFEFTIKNMKEIHLQLTNKPFAETSEEQMYFMTWPMEYNWISNQVAAESSKIRNNFIESEIKKYWDYGKNIFIVYGQGHAVENETYLRKNLK